jgi:hypothetical protein
VPCGVAEDLSEGKYQQLRDKWRATLSIKENECAAVFAGGVSKWQCIDDVMSFFVNFDGRVFLFTSKTNIEFLKKRYPSINVEYSTFSPEELREALCAFDFGLLPRDIDSTNFVAWPNKASEYYNARLTILLKNKEIGFYKTLHDACKIISFKNQPLILDRNNYKHDSSILDINRYVERLIRKYQN